MKHTVIIGNGIAGITAARYIRKLSDRKITVISKESKYFYSRPSLMYIYMGHMTYQHTKPYEDWFWSKNRIDLLHDTVTDINPNEKYIVLQSNPSIQYDDLIIASGSRTKYYNWKGQDATGVSGMVNIQDLQYLEENSSSIKTAVIVGGGLIGIELAEMLKSRGKKVIMLVREGSYWKNVLPKEESLMVNEHILDHDIDLRLNTELLEVIKDDSNKVVGVKTTNGDTIQCEYVGISTGVTPNIDFIKHTEIACDRGILVDNQLKTSVDHIYAIGDCAQLRSPQTGRRPIEAIWYTGRMMGEVIAHNICGALVEYDPGIWFNSAKLFDIEYQVYGLIPTRDEESYDSVFWSMKNRSIRIVYRKDDHTVVGFNLMGIRYRQEVCLQWIGDQENIEFVLKNLKLANFDPEFYEQYEEKIIEQYNQRYGKNIVAKNNGKLDHVLKFLNLKR